MDCPKVVIVAPSFGSRKTAKALQKYGFDIDISMFNEDNGDDEEKDDICSNILPKRLQYFINAFKGDADVAWCMRGGYGSMELIPFLDKDDFAQFKLLAGFCDITALHLYFNQILRWPTLHVDMPECLMGKWENKNYLVDFLKNLDKELIYEIEIINDRGLDNIEGITVGTNLTLISKSIGTIWQLDAEDKIIFIEDAHEANYRLRSMLQHLLQAGVLKGAKAIIFGDFLKCPKADKVLEWFVKQVDIPIFRLRDFGHKRINKPVFLGVKAVIKDKKIVMECPVSYKTQVIENKD